MANSELVYDALMDSTSVSLLRRLRSDGADDAWRRFVDLYAPLIYHWACVHGMDHATASDLVQEVLAKLLVSMPNFRYDPNQRFRGWLRTVVRNQVSDMRRRERTRNLVSINDEDFDPADSDGTEWFVESEYRTFLVQRARDLLKPDFEQKTWDACWLYVAEGHSAAEVAEQLGISENAVRLAKCRVLSRLRQELDGLLD